MNGMPSKIKTNATIFKVLGWIGLICGVLGGIIFLIVGIAAGDEGVIAGVIGGIVFIIIGVVTGLLYIFTAKGIANKKGWAKILGIILAIMALPGFPIGTALGIWILVNFFSDEGKAWFEEGAAPVTPPTAA